MSLSNVFGVDGLSRRPGEPGRWAPSSARTIQLGRPLNTDQISRAHPQLVPLDHPPRSDPGLIHQGRRE
ncbi:hypothetical protein PtA15_16A209 [Puccinia triticina]|uniref:Uncharacterized protein n=1 Tax=Puccinia triticina TaxID=208348 RepID=A0ABY7D3V7_9BASI|nr:uncharacterized protein PtA15_16A209 [Puccinia triticina]WAQ92303.1 hypothetical protein PtA15_16A209 [Puccinia triticina]WAR64040.1 hypothetical protein PtB15_16B199 [Puccinia triticina]